MRPRATIASAASDGALLGRLSRVLLLRATPPRNGAESRADDDPGLRAFIRIYMANRGVWESGWWLGPTVRSPPRGDVDRYLDVFAAFLADVTH